MSPKQKRFIFNQAEKSTMASHGLEFDKEQDTRQHQMLKELRTERYLKMASKIRKKRERVPRVDLDANPFCQDRQLADEYQLQNLNRNPRFYQAATMVSPRKERNMHNYSSLPPKKSLLRKLKTKTPADHYPTHPDFNSLQAPTEMIKSYSLPSFHYLQSKDLTKLYPIDGGKSYTKTTIKAASFGHRPASASRHLDPLSNQVVATKKGPATTKTKPNKTGMSAVDLQALLQPPTPAATKKKADNTTKKKQQSPPEGTNRSTKTMTKKECGKLEKGFNNRLYQSPKLRPQYTLNRPDVDTSIGDLLHKYRRLAVGETSQERDF